MSVKDIDKMKKIVEEESLEVLVDYNAEFEFNHFCPQVQIVYVLELPSSQESLEYHMLTNLSKRIAEINSRYKVGIFFEDASMMPVIDEFDDIQKEIDRLDRENSKFQ